jgi:hypothetical protein
VRVVAAMLAAAIACGWIEGTHAIPINGVEAFEWNEANPELVCNRKAATVHLIAKLCPIPNSALPYEYIVIFHPAPKAR